MCDPSITAGEVGTFEVVAVKCQYERKYRKPNDTATEEDLQQFNFTEQPIPSASPISSPVVKPFASPKLRQENLLSNTIMSTPKANTTSRRSARLINPPIGATPTKAPAPATKPEDTQILVEEQAELHLFDFQSGSFLLQEPSVVATVSEVGPWKYWLQITSSEKDWLGQPVVEDINPVFNFEFLSFIFCHYTDDGSAYSWLLRFKNQETEERFQNGLMQALWESLNQVRWQKAPDDERQYVLDAFQELTMEDSNEGDQEELEEVEEVDDDAGQRSEHYDTDESEDDVVVRDNDGNVNSQLAVGYKHDRSYVVRGSKIGVFKHTPNNNLEFSTNISKVQTPGGKLFSPKKVMLHAEDSNMILQNEADPHSLYRMDLEYGKIIDEWKVHDDITVKTFAPEKVLSRSFLYPLIKKSDKDVEIRPNDRRANLPRPLPQRALSHRSAAFWQQNR